MLVRLQVFSIPLSWTFFCWRSHLYRVFHFSALHPYSYAIHPNFSRCKRRMHMILASFVLKLCTIEVSLLPHLRTNDVIDACILFPAWRRNPDVWYIAYLINDSFYILLTFLKITDKLLVAAQTNHDKCWFCFANEILKCVCICPYLRCAAIPAHRCIFMTILHRIVTHSSAKSFKH